MPDAVGALVDQLNAAFPACEVWLDVSELGAARTIRIVCPTAGGRTVALDASGPEPKPLDDGFLEAIRHHLGGEG